MEMAGWLRHYFPAIQPSGGWAGSGCWIAFMMTRDPEHNPPFYWLGRALDLVDEGGEEQRFRDRLHAAHGAHACRGDERDEAVQDVLTEACAYAWTTTHLGRPHLLPAGEGATLDHGSLLLRVPAHEVTLVAERLRPQRSMQELVRATIASINTAVGQLPDARRGIVFLDTWHDPMYAQGVGYRLELTEPLQHAIRHVAAGYGVGYVLTRPFQWGNALEANY